MRNRQKKQTKGTHRIIMVTAFMIALGGVEEASSKITNFCTDRKYIQIGLVQMSDSVSLPKVDNDSIYNIAEEMPTFPGGQKAMMEYLAKKILYPVELHKVEGRVIVQFIVRKDGKVSDVAIARGLESYLDKEAIIAVETMPKWTPGKYQGEPVSVRYTIPVTFRPPKEEYRDPNVIPMNELVDKITQFAGGLTKKDTVIVPEFPGGKEELQAYLKENVKYPKVSIKRKEEGKVEITFIVTTEGERRMVAVKKGVSSRLDAEALRVVNGMPKWIPGKVGNSIQNVSTSVVVEFKLP